MNKVSRTTLADVFEIDLLLFGKEISLRWEGGMVDDVLLLLNISGKGLLFP